MNTKFSLELAQQLHNSNQIIDFDWAWQVLGYSKKSNAKRMLVSYFEENFDYFVQLPNESPKALPYSIYLISEQKSNRGRPIEKIYLTVECFKQMGMLSKSEQGKKIRKYFLQCEATAKQLIAEVPKMQNDIEKLKAQIQYLLPASRTNYIPPGWNKEVWKQLPPQDKRHFRFLYNHHNFIPNSQTEDESVSIKTLTLQVKQKQKDELKTVVGEVSPEEKERLEALKQEAIRQLQIGAYND